MATSPGHARPHGDFVGAVPGAVVRLDGAGIPGTEQICHHGVAWYARTLGANLLSHLAREPTSSPVESLASSIEYVAHQHQDICDVTHPSSPQATVALLRFERERADFLVLVDTFVVLVRGAPEDLDRRQGGSTPRFSIAISSAKREKWRVLLVTIAPA